MRCHVTQGKDVTSVKFKTALAAALSRTAVLISAAMLVTIAYPTFAFAGPSLVRLVVDPGHGGHDSGAVGGSVQEKTIALQISKRVVDAARRQGWEVKMTRNDDRFIQLNNRIAVANRWNATAFVSIHNNSVGPNPRGNMTIHRGGRSGTLARNIVTNMGRLTDYPDIGSRRDVRGLAVLRGAKVPATIVEVLSVSAGAERAALTDPAVQQKYAEAIVRGLAQFHSVKYYPPVTATPAAAPVSAAPAAAVTPAAAVAPTPPPAVPTKPTTSPAPPAPSAAAPTADAQTSPVAALAAPAKDAAVLPAEETLIESTGAIMNPPAAEPEVAVAAQPANAVPAVAGPDEPAGDSTARERQARPASVNAETDFNWVQQILLDLIQK